jgi:hypothetical protein
MTDFKQRVDRSENVFPKPAFNAFCNEAANQKSLHLKLALSTVFSSLTTLTT